MRRIETIFSVAPDCHVEAGYATLWRRHFYDGIRGVVPRLLRPEGIDFSWARPKSADAAAVTARRAAASQQLEEQIKRAHRDPGVEVVLSYCFSDDLELGLVREVIRMGIPWVNFFCDSRHRFTEVEALARVVSLNWFVERGAVERYRALGVPYVCRPYALNPDYLPEVDRGAAHYPVAFIGVPSANRVTRLGALLLLGCPVTIRGPGWRDPGFKPFGSVVPRRRDWRKTLRSPDLWDKVGRRLFWPLARRRAGGALSDEEFPRFLSECQVVLGLNQGRDEQGRLVSYLKFRDVEFPGYGCCYLTEHNEDIAAVFDVGREVLTFQSVGQAAAEIRRLRRQPARWAALGDAARRRVLAEHTWATRLPQVLEPL